MSGKIKVVVAEVGKPAEIRQVGSGLEPMREIVGGYIEPLRLNGKIFMVVNEEGRLQALPLNRRFTVTDDGIVPGAPPNGTPWGGFTVLGPMFVTKTGGEGFVTLDDEEAEKYREFLDVARSEAV